MEGKISLRQYLVLMFVAALPALVKIVPGQQAALAGRGSWLASLTVAIPAGAAVWLICRTGQSLPETEGLGELFCRCFGRGIGRTVCAVYGIGFVLIAGAALRYCAERFMATIYPNTGMGLFLVVILWLVWWLVQRKLEVLARAGQIFLYAIGLTLAVVLILGVTEMHLYNVWPVQSEQLTGICKAGVPAAGALGIGVGGLFLFGEVGQRRDGCRLALRWTGGMLLLLTVMGFVVMGVFGSSMVGRLQVPFFSLAKEISIGGAAERVEPLVVAMWVFADVTLLAVLIRCGERAFLCAVGERERGLCDALLLAVLPLGYLIAGSAFALDEFSGKWLTVGELMLYAALPLTAAAAGKLRRVL